MGFWGERDGMGKREGGFWSIKGKGRKREISRVVRIHDFEVVQKAAFID